jgi:ATP-binding cassette subfamily B protein RaxB
MDAEDIKRMMARLQFGMHRRVPQILQTESAECGLACLAMVGNYYGYDVDLFHLRQQCGVSSRGANLGQLIGIATSINLQTRPLSLDIDELDQLRLPCILHWDMNHFVVLVAIKGDQYVVHDPAFGRRKISREVCSQHFTGVALEAWPASEFKEVTQRSRLRFTEMLGNVAGLKGALLKIFALSVLVEVINLLLPAGTQLVMDHVIVAEDHHLLIVICLGLLFFIVFKSGLGMFRSWVAMVMNVLIDMQWKAGMFDHLLRLPLSFFEKRKLGDIQARFASLDVVRSTLTTSLVSGMIDVIMTIGLFVAMYLYGGWLVWVVCGFTMIYVVLRLSTYYYYRQASEEKIVKDAKAGSHFMETLYGVGTLKSLGLAPARLQQWLTLSVDSNNAGIRMTRFDMLFSGANMLIATLDQLVILWLGATHVMDHRLTLGMFVAFNAYRALFSERAGSLINLVLQLRMLSLHSDRLTDIVFTAPEETKTVRQLMPKAAPAAFEVRDVTFQYDDLSKPVLANVSLSIAPGESVAITGVSGKGKTTLMKIMAGLLMPTSGTVWFNGIDIHDAGMNNYRQCIACVLQEDKLFSGSIAENIMGFSEHRDEDLLLACAQQCNIHQEIMAMPMGYETLLSELGGGLSGGQKQRILIARALYRQPNILFLDEATSHLDLDNEAHINASIAALRITRIVIAHRPSTIASADRVIVL